MMLRSRIAPTPSGLLHLGNAVNFILTWLMVRKAGGTLRLRIDDADCLRAKQEYLEDIFRQLDWLKLTWDEGPTGPDDFCRRFSQQLRLERYREFLAELDRLGHLYPCGCSRSKIREHAVDGVYPGFCRSRAGGPMPGEALRVRVSEGSVFRVEGQEVALCKEMGDFVLWRKEDLPAYQLVSLVDDLDDRINCIVRGQDLLASTAAQLFLARLHGDNLFAATRFLHHPLIRGEDGRKLSKSDDALSLAALRETGVSSAQVYRVVARQAGLDPADIVTLEDLLRKFCQTV
ncbi:glutamate--tRNA ligase family protein [Thiovibrio frasassiensis]|uniref:Glutamate--tRNA ligase family protein n=1 Tax=Thiovibrio frasassiensis TaxID=2984131 RepID=A0A9X4MLG8_9BACT|nr:glutamate--tRNA ligase family protein [Thiovibrio frasassiensis]MDG4474962.1 glutamate--tRNA ligase family protein [Thiovibrio frasassiensis]